MRNSKLKDVREKWKHSRYVTTPDRIFNPLEHLHLYCMCMMQWRQIINLISRLVIAIRDSAIITLSK